MIMVLFKLRCPTGFSHFPVSDPGFSQASFSDYGFSNAPFSDYGISHASLTDYEFYHASCSESVLMLPCTRSCFHACDTSSVSCMCSCIHAYVHGFRPPMKLHEMHMNAYEFNNFISSD